MVYIPSDEIQQPGVHADEIGFVFFWQGLVLRGIFHDYADQVKFFFESGFISELVEKRLFPKTWISEYENEQFAFIIEHELIKPTVYANEWNYCMLYDAALMVLQIADIAWGYGFNMIDCHKTNVLFKEGHPIYVDLGSFVKREEGSTGWWPYLSFKESYLYILDIWKSGSSLIAKRLMSQGVILYQEDYLIWKYPLLRGRARLTNWICDIKRKINLLSIVGYSDIEKRGKSLRFLKRIINKFHICSSQSINRLQRKTKRLKFNNDNTTANPSENNLTYIKEYIKSHDIKDALVVNPNNSGYAIALFEESGLDSLFTVNTDNRISCGEYLNVKQSHSQVTTLYYDLLNPVLVYGKFPEKRFLSQIVILPHYKIRGKKFDKHNFIVSIPQYLQYSSTGTILIENENSFLDSLADCIPEEYIISRYKELLVINAK